MEHIAPASLASDGSGSGGEMVPEGQLEDSEKTSRAQRELEASADPLCSPSMGHTPPSTPWEEHQSEADFDGGCEVEGCDEEEEGVNELQRRMKREFRMALNTNKGCAIMERNRRRRITLSCSKLRNLLPKIPGSRADMVTVLEMTIAYLETIQELVCSGCPPGVNPQVNTNTYTGSKRPHLQRRNKADPVSTREGAAWMDVGIEASPSTGYSLHQTLQPTGLYIHHQVQKHCGETC